MKAALAIAEILKREGVEMIFGYPVNHLLEYAAHIGIRPIIVRQERIGLHMADAYSRLSRGKKIGVFAMQHGPGAENAFGGVAQCFGESIPVLVIPMGYPARIAHVPPNFSSVLNMKHITKSAEPVTSPAEIPNVMRRAFTQLRNGRFGPCLVEVPTDMFNQEVAEPIAYEPVMTTRFGPDPEAVRKTADMLLAAKRLVLHVGQGVHWAGAWPQLKRLAELLAAPVMTTLQGKSAFPEDHMLSLGAGGRAYSRTIDHFLKQSDVIFGIGCSFTETNFGTAIPHGKTIIHSTLDPLDVNKDVIAAHAMIGDAGLTIDALIAELEPRIKTPRDPSAVAAEIASIRAEWLAEWMPKLTSNDAPLSPYRVLWDLANTVDRAETIITHDAGSPRDQLSPFWQATTPLSYLGWGKTTQLGYGLGLAMGAKLACPDKLCINVWGDAAIGFTGMDFETAAREKLPILSILLNNSAMAIELDVMPQATERYRATDISGDYAAFARALGGYGERVEHPDAIASAIRRGIAATEAGQPALLEFITAKEKRASRL